MRNSSVNSPTIPSRTSPSGASTVAKTTDRLNGVTKAVQLIAANSISVPNTNRINNVRRYIIASSRSIQRTTPFHSTRSQGKLVFIYCLLLMFEIFNSQRIRLEPLLLVKKMHSFEVGLQIDRIPALDWESRGEASDEPQCSAWHMNEAVRAE